MSIRSTVLDSLSSGGAESYARSIVKTVGYRVLMVIVTVVVAYAVTDDPTSALQIGVAANVIKTVTYFGYERLWTRISWGLRDS